MSKKEVLVVGSVGGRINLDMFTNIGDIVKKGGQSGEIQKGHIHSAFAYGDEKLTFQKTGKQVSEKLTGKIEAYTAKKASIAQEASDILLKIREKGCKDEPTDTPWQAEDSENCEYKTFGWEQRDKYQPKTTSNELVSASTVMAGTQEVKPEKTVSELMYEYNSKVGKIYDVMKDLEIINALKNNLEEKKTYTFNLRQIKALGF